jgi:integrase
MIDTGKEHDTSALALALLKGHAITHGHLREITEKLKKRIAVFSTETAIEGFQAYLEAKAKRNTREGYKVLLARFLEHFAGQNLPELYARDVKIFLSANWNHVQPSTLQKIVRQLGAFFEWCNLYLAEEGSPQFHNPCKLIKVDKPKMRRPDLITPHEIGRLLDYAEGEEKWLAIAVMATGGLRISEFLKLKPQDISDNGRRLRLIEPKSGNDVETAVVPAWVAKRLAKYVAEKGSYPFLGGAYSWEASERKRKSLGNAIGRIGRAIHVKLNPHKLRAFCATFWEREGDLSMMNYVLRHSGTSVNGVQVISTLDSRYVSRLTDEEAMSRQDENMTERRFA